MKTKLILFDIDRTLFDPSSFLNDFYESIHKTFNLSVDEIEKIKMYYEENKKENGYFYPNQFLDKVCESFTKIDKQKIEEIFWNVDLFNKNLYKDTPILNDLSKLAEIGIFSKGDLDFQIKKITPLKKYFNEDKINIFKNKIEKIEEVLEKYIDYEVYFVDNEIEILNKIRTINNDIKCILIERGNNSEDLDIIKIRSLEEIKNLL